MKTTEKEAINLALKALDACCVVGADETGRYTIEATPKIIIKAIDELLTVLAEQPVSVQRTHRPGLALDSGEFIPAEELNKRRTSGTGCGECDDTFECYDSDAVCVKLTNEPPAALAQNGDAARNAFYAEYGHDARKEMAHVYVAGWKAALAAAIPPGHVVVPVEHIETATRIIQWFAERNPKYHDRQGVEQDPYGAHAWIAARPGGEG